MNVGDSSETVDDVTDEGVPSYPEEDGARVGDALRDAARSSDGRSSEE